jgi:hypothetical protein
LPIPSSCSALSAEVRRRRRQRHFLGPLPSRAGAPASAPPAPRAKWASLPPAGRGLRPRRPVLSPTDERSETTTVVRGTAPSDSRISPHPLPLEDWGPGACAPVLSRQRLLRASSPRPASEASGTSAGPSPTLRPEERGPRTAVPRRCSATPAGMLPTAVPRLPQLEVARPRCQPSHRSGSGFKYGRAVGSGGSLSYALLPLVTRSSLDSSRCVSHWLTVQAPPLQA